MSLSEELDVKPGQKQIEDVINMIKGVKSCSVVTTDDGKIEEIHIVAESNRNPKQVVRDIESSLMAQLGMQIDHKKISVAQTKEIKRSSGEYKRLKITDFQTKGNKCWLYCKVTLCLGEKLFEGEAEGPNSGFNRYKLIALASTKAVEEILEQKIRLVVEDFAWQTLSGHEVAVIILSCVFEHKIETLVGACLAEHDKDVAVIKAVLDALNRRLDIL